MNQTMKFKTPFIDGGIYPLKNGTWDAVAIIGHDTATGKLLKKHFCGKTEDEARKKREERMS